MFIYTVFLGTFVIDLLLVLIVSGRSVHITVYSATLGGGGIRIGSIINIRVVLLMLGGGC